MAPKSKKSWAGRSSSLAPPTEEAATSNSATPVSAVSGKKSWSRPSSLAPPADASTASIPGGGDQQRKSWNAPSKAGAPSDALAGSEASSVREPKKSWSRPSSSSPPPVATAQPVSGKKSWSRPSSLAPPADASLESSPGGGDQPRKSWKSPSKAAAPSDAPVESNASPVQEPKKSWSRPSSSSPPPVKQSSESKASPADERKKSWSRPSSASPPPVKQSSESKDASPIDKRKKSWSRPSSASPPPVKQPSESKGVPDDHKKSWKRPSSLAPQDHTPGEGNSVATERKKSWNRPSSPAPPVKQLPESDGAPDEHGKSSKTPISLAPQDKTPGDDGKSEASPRKKSWNRPSSAAPAAVAQAESPANERKTSWKRTGSTSPTGNESSELQSSSPDERKKSRMRPGTAIRASKVAPESASTGDPKAGESAENPAETHLRMSPLPSSQQHDIRESWQIPEAGSSHQRGSAFSRASEVWSNHDGSQADGNSPGSVLSQISFGSPEPPWRNSDLKLELSPDSTWYNSDLKAELARMKDELAEERQLAARQSELKFMARLKEEFAAESSLASSSSVIRREQELLESSRDLSKLGAGRGAKQVASSRLETLRENLRQAKEQVALLQGTCKFKGVEPSDELHQKIAGLFQKQGLPHAHIKQVIKPEMPSPYVQAYEANRGGKEEKELWLCTGGVSPRMILESPCGLDYRYSAVGKLGRGLYGVVNAIYADCFYAFKTRRQEHQLLLFRGITGRSYNYNDAAVSLVEEFKLLSKSSGAVTSRSVSLGGYDSAFADDLCSACTKVDLGAIMQETCTCSSTHRYQPEAYNRSADCSRQLSRRRLSSPVYCLFPPCEDHGLEGPLEKAQQTTDQLIDAHRLRPHILALPVALVEYSNPETFDEPDWNTWFDKDATLKMSLLQEIKEQQDFQMKLQSDILQQKDQLQYELEEAESARDGAARDLDEYMEASVHTVALKNETREMQMTLKHLETEAGVERERSERRYSDSVGKLEQQARDAEKMATIRVSILEQQAQEAEFLESMREASLVSALEAAESKCELQSSEFNAELQTHLQKVDNLTSEMRLLEMVASTTKLENDGLKQDHLAEQRQWQEHQLAEASECRSMALLQNWARLVLLVDRCQSDNAHTSSLHAAATTLAAQRVLADDREESRQTRAMVAHRLMHSDWQMRLASNRMALRLLSMTFECWRHQILDKSAQGAAGSALLLTQALEDLKLKAEEDEMPAPWRSLLPESVAALFSEKGSDASIPIV